MVDLHNLNDRPSGSSSASCCARRSSPRSAARRSPAAVRRARRAQQVRATRGPSPIKEILLDIAERGRSLGIILIGAQQTASEVERRIVANSAIRVVGRLDPAEAARGEYGFLPSASIRATPAQARHDVRRQPGCRCPIVVEFPFPAWATRASEAGAARPRPPDATCADPFEALCVKIPHTADWHVGKTLRGQSRAPTSTRRARRDRGVADDEQVDAVLIAGDLFDTAAPRPRSEQIVYQALLGLPGMAPASWSSPATTTDGPAAGRRPAVGAGPRRVASPGDPTRRGGEIASRDGHERTARSPCCRSCRSGWRAISTTSWPPAADQHAGLRRPVRQLSKRSSASFRPDDDKLVVAHVFVDGGMIGGASASAHESTTACRPPPSRPTAQYVALGHLHRSPGQPRGPSPSTTAARRCSSTSARPDRKSVNLVDLELRPAALPRSTRALATGSPVT